MSPELDVPLTPSADQIRRREFVTVRRGYDPGQVRQYLLRVAEQVEALEDLIRTTRTAASAASPFPQARPEAPAEPAPEPEPSDLYALLSQRMADLLRTAEATAEQITSDAAAERDRMLAEASAEADRIRTDAQARAESVRHEAELINREARVEAERLLSGLDARREALVAELDTMRDRLMEMARGLGALAAEHEAEGAEQPIAESTAEPPDPRYVELWADPAEASESVSGAAEGTVTLPDAPAPESSAPPEVDPLEQLFVDIPTLSLEDLDPGEFDR